MEEFNSLKKGAFRKLDAAEIWFREVAPFDETKKNFLSGRLKTLRDEIKAFEYDKRDEFFARASISQLKEKIDKVIAEINASAGQTIYIDEQPEWRPLEQHLLVVTRDQAARIRELNRDIEDKKKRIVNLTSEIMMLRRIIDNLRGINADIDAERKRVVLINRNLAGDLNLLLRNNAELTAQNRKLTDDNKAWENLYLQYVQWLGFYQDQLGQAFTTIRRQEQLIQNANAISDRNIQITNMQLFASQQIINQNQQLIADLEAEQKRVADLQAELAALKGKYGIEEYEKKIQTNLQQMKAGLAKHRSSIQGSDVKQPSDGGGILLEYEKHLRMMADKTLEAMDRADRIKAEKEALKSRHASEIATLNETISKGRKFLEEQTKKVTDCEQKLNACNEDNKKLSNEKNELELQNNDLIKQNTELEEKLSQLNIQIEQLRKKHAECEKDSKDADLYRILTQMLATIADEYKIENKNFPYVLQIIQQKLGESKNSVLKIEPDVKKLNDEITMLRNKINDLTLLRQQDGQNYGIQLGKQKEEITDLTNRVKELTEKNQELLYKHRDWEASMNKLNAELDRALQTIEVNAISLKKPEKKEAAHQTVFEDKEGEQEQLVKDILADFIDLVAEHYTDKEAFESNYMSKSFMLAANIDKLDSKHKEFNDLAKIFIMHLGNLRKNMNRSTVGDNEEEPAAASGSSEKYYGGSSGHSVVTQVIIVVIMLFVILILSACSSLFSSKKYYYIDKRTIDSKSENSYCESIPQVAEEPKITA